MPEPAKLSSIDELRPDVRALVIKWRDEMERRGSPVVILETRRTPERQDWLYAQGRTRPGVRVTNVRGNDPRARHVAPPGMSTAIDFAFPGRTTDEMFAPTHPWTLAGEIAERIGFTWGGRWTSPVDLGHIQYDTAAPAGLPPTELARGAAGADVRALQAAIFRLYAATGRRFPALALALDGDFGPATDRAVRALQGLYALPVTGVVTPELRAALDLP
jgi:peptidoglycan L-alanyl-D-glutamate endopeptidase CwlK